MRHHPTSVEMYASSSILFLSLILRLLSVPQVNTWVISSPSHIGQLFRLLNFTKASLVSRTQDKAFLQGEEVTEYPKTHTVFQE